MSYNGFLLKVGKNEIPLKYFGLDTYKILRSTSDFDSYRDADGVLHRNALSHKVMKVEFTTPYMYGEELDTLMNLIRSQYTNATEKKVIISAYDKESNSYVSATCYVPDITFQIAQNSPRGFVYAPTRIAFIEY